jgi:hypothetical protein
MSYFIRKKEAGEEINLAQSDTFRFRNNIEVLGDDVKIVVGKDLSRNNISLKYPGSLGGGGIYVNDPEKPILEVDTNGNISIPSLIIEEVVFDDVETNILKTKDTGQVLHESTSIFNELINAKDQIKIAENPVKTNNCAIHIQDTGPACIFIEADIDDVPETDHAYLIMAQDSNFIAYKIGGGGTGLRNSLVFEGGVAPPVGASGNDGYYFRLGSIVNNGTGLEPTFNVQNDIFHITRDSIDCYENVDMLNNDIVNVNSVSSSFDPAVNIRFIDAGISDDVITIAAPRTTIGGYLDIPGSANPGSAGLSGIGGRLWNSGTNVNWITTTKTTDILNPYDQDLTTTGDVTFTSVTADNYNITSLDQSSRFVIPSRIIASNTDTELINWNTVTTSSRVNADALTGVFAPVAGLYTLTYQAFIESPVGTIEMGVRIVDDLGNTIYASVVQSTDLFAPEIGAEAAQYENLTGYFDGIRTYTLHVKLNATETMNFGINISRIL